MDAFESCRAVQNATGMGDMTIAPRTANMNAMNRKAPAARDLETEGSVATPNVHKFVLTNPLSLRALATAS